MEDVDSQVALLRSMFENVDESKIRKILSESGTVDRAIDNLLNIGSDSENIPAVTPVVPTSANSNANGSTDNPAKELSQEEADALFAQNLMLEEINRTSGGGSAAPIVPGSDEDYARRLQAEINGETEDERMARRLQSQWGGNGNQNHHQQTPNLEDVINFDVSKLTKTELDEFTSGLKEQMLPILSQQLKEVELPEIEETIDAGKKVGPITFSLTKIKVEEAEIPKDKVTMELEGQQIELKITDIKLTLEKFDWSYKKEKFPKLKDSGHATCGVSEVVVNVRLTWTVRNMAPSIAVSLCEVKIGNLNLKITGTIASVIYNIILAAFKKLIKTQLEKAMADMVKNAISEHATDLLND